MDNPGQLPLRSFTVYDNCGETILVEGHAVKVSDNGVLDIQRFGGPQLWTVALFAPDAWTRVAADMPTEDEQEMFTEFGKQQQRDAMTRQSLMLPGSNTKRG